MKNIFINVSNHPSDKWSKAQTEAAKEHYIDCRIIDVKFPNVPSAANRTEIVEIAKSVEKQVSEICDREQAVNVRAMVQGEMTLTFALVQVLVARSIRCYAGCSERISKINTDGSKTASFEFVQFRPYSFI